MVLSTLLIVAALFVYLFYTGFGRQIRAVAINERTATLLGVNPNFVYFQTFFISGALAGAAGVLIGIAFNAVHFLMGDAYMLRAFVVIVLGGLGSVMGALIAGLLLGLVQTLTIAYVSSGLSDAIIFSHSFRRAAGSAHGLLRHLAEGTAGGARMIDFVLSYLPLLNLIILNCGLALSQYVVLRAGVFSVATAGLASIGAYTAGLLILRAGVPRAGRRASAVR